MLFDGIFGTPQSSSTAVSPPSTQEETEADPKPKVNLFPSVPGPSEGPLTRRRQPVTQRSFPGSGPAPIPFGDKNSPPRPFRGDSQSRGRHGGAGPQTMSRGSPAPPPSRESAPQHRGRTSMLRPCPPHAPRDKPVDPEGRYLASRQRGGFRYPSSHRGTAPAPYTRPTTPPSTWNYDWNQQRHE